jgi:hypothetical protein
MVIGLRDRISDKKTEKNRNPGSNCSVLGIFRMIGIIMYGCG